MMIKKLFLLPLLCSFAINAQNNEKNNFITYHSKIIKADISQRYLVLARPEIPSNKLVSSEREKWWQQQLKKQQPICFNDKSWIFTYEMLGEDDSFYNAKSQAENLANISSNSFNSKDYAINISIEEYNPDFRSQNFYNDICDSNNAQVYIGRSQKHGIITYVGDISIYPPF